MLLRRAVLAPLLAYLLALLGIQAGPPDAAARGGVPDGHQTGQGSVASRAYPDRTASKANELLQSDLAHDVPGVTAHRPVTVADAIQMTRVAGSGLSGINYTGAASSDFAAFSPDRKRFVIVVKKGNLERNTNEYSMLLFETDKVFDAPTPKKLTSIASTSNSEGIKDITWLDDNDTILFLGKHSDETAQLYSIRCASGKVEQLSHQSRNVVAYSASTNGRKIVLGMENPVKDLIDADALRNGITVSSQTLCYPLVIGHAVVCCQDLFFLEGGVKSAAPLHVRDQLWQNPLELFLSPNGRYLVVKTIVGVGDVPGLWSKYTANDVKTLFSFVARGAKASLSFFRRYELIDTKTNVSQFLLDSPVNLPGSEVGWSPDSESVILTGVYLPLDVSDPSEFAARQSHMFTVEVRIPSLEVVKIADRDMKLVGWDANGEHAMFRPSRNPNLNGTSSQAQHYRKRGPRWELTASDSDAAIHDAPEITVEQDLNIVPRIVALDVRRGKKGTLFDLNPQFRDLSFGKVEEVKWIGGGGKEVSGGLYLPPRYESGKRYPLVIQTHGFDPHGFWIEGPFTTAFAAQPLAGKGIIVLQVPDSHDSQQTTEEAPLMMETFERAIDYLDKRGIIDKSRVGIIGFSRTCLYVKYTLTHSKYHFAAGSAADGVDGGYFQYVIGRNNPAIAALNEQLVGALPFGDGLSLWQKHSPAFLLDKVDTPMRLEAHGGFDTGNVQSEWEWYSGLVSLGKPVELIYLPDGTHILQKPWERMVSQQGNVDWFGFWLKSEEDPDPTKAEQYKRWRELRKLQEENEKKSVAPAN